MRVFVAGASGALGSRLVPQLIERGHEVIGTSTSPATAERVRASGAEAVVLDLLDARAVREAVLEARPEAITHQATALADLRDFKHFDRSFAQTNRLRTEGTDALLAAAREAGVRRVVAQSFASSRYARVGGPVVVMMGTESRGASNAKAKRELGWKPRYPSWRQGFVASYASG